MAGALFDERAFQVIQSFRPYLGPLGNGYVAALESLLELLSSEPAKKTLDALRFFGLGEEFKMLADESNPDLNPFTLFLILILLVLADLPEGKDGGVKPKGIPPDEETQQLPPFAEPGPPS